MRAAVDVPVLRKDFVIVINLEARAYGADLVLLIVAALEQDARPCRAPRSGVDATGRGARWTTSPGLDAGRHHHRMRDLTTLEVDRVSLRVAHLIPDTCIKIAESGVQEPGSIAHEGGANAVGQLVTGKIVSRSIVTAGAHPALRHSRRMTSWCTRHSWCSLNSSWTRRPYGVVSFPSIDGCPRSTGRAFDAVHRSDFARELADPRRTTPATSPRLERRT